MIDSLWTERRAIVRVTVPPEGRPPWPRSLPSAARLERGSARSAPVIGRR